jgi:hypothetical protein
MTQHTFILPINGATSGIEFEETQYRLNAGETLVGQQNDIPEKKQIGHVITAFDGIEVFEQELDITIDPLQVKTPQYLNIESILEDLYGDSTDNSKGITVEFDLSFYMDHVYEDLSRSIIHYSCTANQRIRFSVLRAETQTYHYTALQYLNRQGKWVEYFSENVNLYQEINSSGNFDFLGDPVPFPLSIVTSGSDKGKLKLENNLDQILNSAPQFDTSVFGKMRVFEHSTNDYSYEVETP